MKPALSLFLILAMGVSAQSQNANSTNSVFEIVARGAHHRVWEKAVEEPGPNGKSRMFFHRVTELATGICYANESGEMVDSNPNFEIRDGIAIAERCQHKLRISARLKDLSGSAADSVLECWMPDGKKLRLKIAAINLYSKETGRSLLIGTLREVEGKQTAPNEITFFNAIDGLLNANVRVRNELHQWSHDLVFTENLSEDQLEKLGSLGLDPEEMDLEVWHEVLESPAASLRSSAKGSNSGQDIGSEVEFPTMKLAEGRGFLEGSEPSSSHIAKDWVQHEGATYLVEHAKYRDVRKLMQQLPESRLSVSIWKPSTTRFAGVGKATKWRAEAALNQGALLAHSQARAPRFVWDYTTVNTTQTNLICAGNITYYVPSKVVVAGTLTLEGNAVIKLGTSSSAGFAASNIVCNTGPYRPVVITALDRNGVGEDIGSGTPSGYYGGIALDLRGGSGGLLSRVHFSYLSNAIAGT